MNEEKKPIVVGRMKSGEIRYHIEDDVLLVGGICRPLTATDHKHPVNILEVRNGNNSDREHYEGGDLHGKTHPPGECMIKKDLHQPSTAEEVGTDNHS